MKKLILLSILISNLFSSNMQEGIVYSNEEVKLSLPLDGIISNIYVKDGDKVKKGDLVLKLDDELQKLEVLRRKEILNDNSEYNANKANLKIVKNLYTSTKKLYEKTASVSKDELSNLQIQYQNLRGKVRAYSSKKRQEKVEFKIANEVLNKYKLKSPINGVISELKYNQGEWAKMGEVVVVVVDVDNCYVELNIDEPMARNLKYDKKVSIVSNNETIKKEGYIYYIAPSAESTSALVKVRVKFKNNEPRITPGVIAKVVFEDELKVNISAK